MAEDLGSQKSRNRGITAEISGPDSGPPLAPRSSPTFWPGETGLEHLGAPQQGPKVFWVSGCVRPSVGSSSLLRQYRQATPRCYVPCCEPVTRQRGGNSEPPCQFESHPLRTVLRVSSSHPSPVVAHQPAGPCGSATGGAGRRSCIASPPAALTVGDHSRSHGQLLA